MKFPRRQFLHLAAGAAALPAVSHVAGAQVQVGFDVMVTSLPHVRTGALGALGVAGKNRFGMLPDVPTIAETVPGYEARTWAGFGGTGLGLAITANNETAMQHVERLKHDPGFINPVIMESNGEIIWTTSELLREAFAATGRARRRGVRSEM